MHLYFLTRGVKQQRDLFVMFMQSQMFNWKRKNLKTNKDETIAVQGALRPIELWEYVFPEECLSEVLTMLDIKNVVAKYGSLGKTKEKILRRMLGKDVKPLPDWKETKINKYVEKRGLAIYPIGIKKDLREKASWGYEQEML